MLWILGAWGDTIVLYSSSRLHAVVDIHMAEEFPVDKTSEPPQFAMNGVNITELTKKDQV